MSFYALCSGLGVKDLCNEYQRLRSSWAIPWVSRLAAIISPASRCCSCPLTVCNAFR